MKVTGTIKIGPSVPKTVAINGRIVVFASGRTIIKSLTLTRTGDTATMSATLPYSWKADAFSKMTITFSANANATFFIAASGSVTLNMPANGATTTVTIPVSF